MKFKHKAQIEKRPWKSVRLHAETLSIWLRERNGVIVYHKHGFFPVFVPYNHLEEDARDESDYTIAPPTIQVEGTDLEAMDHIQVEDYLESGDASDFASTVVGRGMLMRRAMKAAFDWQGEPAKKEKKKE